jgi:hypothetical protein
MERAPEHKTLAKPLGLLAVVVGAIAWVFVLASVGPAGTQGFLTGAALFVPGLILAAISAVIGFTKAPRAVLVPALALFINGLPFVVFFFFLSVLKGMHG